MLEAFGFCGFIVACVLLVERPWRNWRVAVNVDREKAAEVTTNEGDTYKQTVHTQPANVTPQQILQVHQAGLRQCRQGVIHQLYNPVMN